MNTIGPRPSAADALREQVAALRTQAARQGPASGAAAAADARGTAATLAGRIACLDPAHPDSRRQAVRLFLESRIAGEFGAALLTDPAFPRLLDAVQQQMQQDAQLAAAMETLGSELLAG